MDGKISCSHCGRFKSKDQFTGNQKVCNTCRNDKSFTGWGHRGAVFTKYKRYPDKKVNCLRCDRKFIGRINVRVCGNCKSLDIYNDHVEGMSVIA
jgi:hypothetical protein